MEVDTDDSLAARSAASGSRAISSEPSPGAPHRDSLEDADTTLTRKRLRLDSGDTVRRSVSVEFGTPPANSKAAKNAPSTPEKPAHGSSSPKMPNKVTINVRLQSDASEVPETVDQQNASQATAAAGPDDTATTQNGVSAKEDPTSDLSAFVRRNDSLIDAGAGNVPSQDNRAPKSPDVESAFSDELREGEPDIRAVFSSFPLHNDDDMAYVDTAKTVTALLQTSSLDPALLDNLSQWLEDHVRQAAALRSFWKAIYLDEHDFWEEIGTGFFKLINRTKPVCDDDSSVPDKELPRLVMAYTNMSWQLAQIDMQSLAELGTDGSDGFYNLFWKPFKAMNLLMQPTHNSSVRLALQRAQPDILSSFSEAILRPTAARKGGLQVLASFVRQVMAQLHHFPTLHAQVMSVIRYTHALTSEFRPIISHSDPTEYSHSTASLAREILGVFQGIDGESQFFTDGRVLSLPSFEARRDLLTLPSILLQRCAQLDDELAADLFRDLVSKDDICSKGCKAEVLAEVWKMKLLKKCFVKSKMEMRVFAVEIMSASLVEIWKHHSATPGGDEVVHLVADILLKEEVANYIVGVDSHPNLISRSSNIIGFFIVSCKYGQAETDLIWNTVANSPDPRVVAATIQMISGMMNLLRGADRLYLCHKLAQLPLEAFDNTMLSFWAQLFDIIFHQGVGQPHWTEADDHMSVFDLCVQLMRSTFPGRTRATNCSIVHSEASSQLLRATHAARFEDREMIYKKLIGDIDGHADLAAASAEILFCMLRNSPSPRQDMDMVAELGLLRATVEDYASFVSRWPGLQHSSDSASPMLAELSPRLDLINLLLSRRPQSAPVEVYSKLWDVTVGDLAIDDTARDKAWGKLADLARPQQARHSFLDMCLSDFLPNMAPELFTPQSFQFIESTVRYIIGVEGGPKELDDGTIDIPGVPLLWQVMLAVPSGSIENLVVVLLAGAHQDSSLIRMSKASVTKTHVALAKRCIEKLTKEWEIAHPTVADDKTAETSMVVDQSPEISMAEARFSRITRFLSLLLQNIRSSTKYLLPPTQASQKLTVTSDGIVGQPLTIHYQGFNGHQGNIESLTVGNLETRRQLYNRLRDATGFASFKTILGGHPVDLLELPTQTLEDWGRAEVGSFLVKEIKTTALAAHESALDVGRCETELALLEHFDVLYKFLEPDDNFAQLTYDFLAAFPPFEGGKLASLVNGSATLDEAFPDGKSYQIRYSIRCLQTRLETQVRTRSVDESFVQGTLRVLSSFIARNGIASGDANFTGELVTCLHRFLLEAPTQAHDLVEPSALADRLFDMLRGSAQGGVYHAMAGQIYTALLELATHSELAWQRFCDQEDLRSLHSALLFGKPAKSPLEAGIGRGASTLQSQIAVTIRGKVKAGLRWIDVSPSQTAKAYWNILEPLIPRCLDHAVQADDLLQTANAVLEILVAGYSEDELRRPESQTLLQTCFLSCINLLGEHEHREFVGRNETDVVVRGLARMADFSYLHLTDVGDVDSNQLIETLSERLLFPPFSPAGIATRPPTPVLESSSRKAVYDLLLNTCQDTSDLHQLLQHVQDVLYTDDFSRTMYYREYFLRASSGLVGIRNLGNTCYMNALLTQLYMNIDFRKFMLGLHITDPKAQGLVLAIQALFAHMQNGYRKYVDASELSRLITTFEGEAIDVSQQMDVEEFFNLKFDQTEAQILSEKDKKAFTSIYGGQMINQIKSRECEHVSERLEPYFAVQCDVKGKTSLLESLQAFVQGDAMEGDNKYKCESCGGRFVNAIKRTCLKDVPDNLIFHLKRFDFDIGTMQRSKINDLFEFPMHIDVSPFTFDHIDGKQEPGTEDRFDLVGVLLHKGVAEHGHYFSYIRSRPCMPNEPPRWFCFDDADVTEFSPSEIKEKCYGGMIDPKEISFIDGPPVLKGYNAYMLFYQRAGTIEDHAPLVSLDAQLPKVEVPSHIAESISQQNEVLLREYTLLDPTHLEFLKQLLDQLPSNRRRRCSKTHQLEDCAIRTALMYLHQVFSRNKDVPESQSFIDYIQETISGCHLCQLAAIRVIFPDQSELGGEFSIASDLLIRSTVGKIRQSFQDFVAATISELKADSNVSEEEYGVAKDDATYDPAFPFYGDTSVIVRVVQAMSYHLEHLPANTRSWDHFFGFLCSIAGLGVGEQAALLEYKIFTRCLELIVMKYEILEETPRGWRWLAKVMEKRSIPHNRLLELIDMMMDFLELNPPESIESDDRLSDFDPERQKFPLTPYEYYMLTRKHPEHEIPFFVYRILEVWDSTKMGRDYASKIFIRIMQSDIVSPRHLYNTLLNGIEATNNAQAYLDAAAQFCTRASERMIDKTVRVAVQCTLSVETSGLGLSLLRFFDAVATKESRGCTDNQLRGFEVVVMELPNWAPPLILSTDADVREQVTKLVRLLLSKDVPVYLSGSPIEAERLRSVRVLASNLSRQLARFWEEGTAGKRAVRAAVNVMHACKEYLASLTDDVRDPNDDDLIIRANEHLLRHQQWPWQDDDQSDDWQSDTNVSDDDVVEVS